MSNEIATILPFAIASSSAFFLYAGWSKVDADENESTFKESFNKLGPVKTGTTASIAFCAYMISTGAIELYGMPSFLEEPKVVQAEQAVETQNITCTMPNGIEHATVTIDGKTYNCDFPEPSTPAGMD